MSTLKLGWGSKIAFLYIGFVLLIVVLVTASMRQEVDLVADNYYEQELAYQDVLDAGKNQSTLSGPVSIHANETMVTIEFPEEFSRQAINGNIQFYSPIERAWDKEIALNSIQGGMTTIPRSELQRTKYKIKISWEVEGKKYYQESDLNLF